MRKVQEVIVFAFLIFSCTGCFGPPCTVELLASLDMPENPLVSNRDPDDISIVEHSNWKYPSHFSKDVTYRWNCITMKGKNLDKNGEEQPVWMTYNYYKPFRDNCSSWILKSITYSDAYCD